MIFCLVFVGCGDAQKGPYIFENATGNDVAIVVTQDGKEYSKLLTTSDKTLTVGDYYEPIAKVVKSLTDKNIVDYRYVLNRELLFLFKIENSATALDVKIQNVTGKTGYTLVGVNGSMGDYSDANTFDLSTAASTWVDSQKKCYVISPSFQIHNAGKDVTSDFKITTKIVSSENTLYVTVEKI